MNGVSFLPASRREPAASRNKSAAGLYIWLGGSFPLPASTLNSQPIKVAAKIEP